LRTRLQRDVEKLKGMVISLGTLVEERYRMAVKGLEVPTNVDLAEKVYNSDLEIDKKEVELEEEGLKILALHQPVADDLRYIVAVLKMNNDLERIGDLAVNIAGRAIQLREQGHTRLVFDYGPMCRSTGEMLKKSLDALISLDLDLAYEVCVQDDEVDSMKRAIQAQFASELSHGSISIESLTNQFLISRHLERIADHATNIAEDVIYFITGTIHRHRGRKTDKEPERSS
jgi:phosphate transport system protein